MIFEYTTIFVHVRFVNEALFSVFCSVGFVKKKAKIVATIFFCLFIAKESISRWVTINC